MIGHSIAASGAIEAVALAMSLSESVVPPTARDHSPRLALSTSFGFGGQNGALVMKAA